MQFQFVKNVHLGGYSSGSPVGFPEPLESGVEQNIHCVVMSSPIRYL